MGAADTPTPSPSSDPNALGRLGYIKPVATHKELQPEMDDFADSVVRQFQEGLPVKVVYLAGAGVRKAVSSGACGDDHLSGLIVTRKENVLDYKNTHGSAWDQLMRTGSVDSRDAGVTAAPSHAPTATGATTTPH
jgi:hypothetical protein